MLQVACFSDINNSQGSVATCLSCGGIFYNTIARNLLMVKEFWQLASIWGKNRLVPFSPDMV